MKKLLLILPVIVILAAILFCFVFFYISESKAKEIITSDYYRNSSAVCDKFFVDGSRCPAFINCYAGKALDAMPEKLLTVFAKDINSGKSSAIDSYDLINGKQIGENCISQILNIPQNTNVNIINGK